MKSLKQYIAERWVKIRPSYFLGDELSGDAYRWHKDDIFTIAKKDGKWRIEDYNGEEVGDGFTSLAKAKSEVLSRLD